MGARDYDPMSEYIIVDGKLYSKDYFQRRDRAIIEGQIERMIQRQLHPEIRREEMRQAVQANPLLAAPPKERKVPRSRGGLGKCYICNHPHRAKIEESYKRYGGNALKVHRDIIAAGGRVSVPAVYNHFKRHYQAPGAPAPAQGQP